MANTPPPLVPGFYYGFWEYSGEYAKTANYTIPSPGTANFNGGLFTNTGATGSVTFTLPAIAPNLRYAFKVIADQAVTIASAEGTNMVALNNASASSVAFSTGGQQIGGGVIVETNEAGTKWLVTNTSAGSNTITVA